MVQGGDYQNFNGTGGESFDGGTFSDESFVIRHDREGVVSMANRGKHTNGSQFFITLAKTPHLDGKHVAFGHVTYGMDVIKDVAQVETEKNTGRPIMLERVIITDCGIVNTEASKKIKSNEKRNRKHEKESRKSRRSRNESSSDSGSYSREDSSSDSSTSKHRKHSRRKRHRRYDTEKSSRKKGKDKYRGRRRHEKRKYDSDSSTSSDYRRKKHKKSRKRSKRKK